MYLLELNVCKEIHMHILCMLVFDILNRCQGPCKDLFKEVLTQNVCMYIRGTSKSLILIGFSLINHPFWGTTIFGNTQMNAKLHPEIPQKFSNQNRREPRSGKLDMGGVF